MIFLCVGGALRGRGTIKRDCRNDCLAITHIRFIFVFLSKPIYIKLKVNIYKQFKNYYIQKMVTYFNRKHKNNWYDNIIHIVNKRRKILFVLMCVITFSCTKKLMSSNAYISN